ncbi:DUF488 domain-containing protein [Gulosibacter faecalis]|jgi:uncharacterized protein YeaO (DUF488 family)|uniref:DUF488 domain-containing protein n=1 Tax=Gulosibacter faecalis TaxID=272240 RepID=A0ABW5UW98_9MICO|nr:DUF488 family protein [Gulosibacter faecalis]
MSKSTIKLKRIYDDPAKADGYRVLVDRLWPRGEKKADAKLDEWLKDVAPSPDLRTWWNHDPDRLDEFAERYRAELDDNDAVDQLREIVDEHPTTTLLYAARDEKINHAVVLRDYLKGD